MTKDAPAFDLHATMSEAVRLAVESGCEVRISRTGAITVKPQGSDVSPAALRMRRMRERRLANSDAVTPVTPCYAPPPSPSSSLSPLSSTPPIPTLPPAPPPAAAHVHARDAVEDNPPTVEESLSYAKTGSTLPISAEVVKAWHADREKVGWKVLKAGHMYPMRDWRSDLRNFAQAWKRNDEDRGASRPSNRPKVQQFRNVL